MPFAVQPGDGEGDVWKVLDEEGRPVFTGTWRQCEDWLDQYEHDLRRQEKREGLWRSWLKRWFGKWSNAEN